MFPDFGRVLTTIVSKHVDRVLWKTLDDVLSTVLDELALEIGRLNEVGVEFRA